MRRGRSALGGFLGNVIMSIMSYEVKCGLPALLVTIVDHTEATAPARTGRAPCNMDSLGNTMMRRIDAHGQVRPAGAV